MVDMREPERKKQQDENHLCKRAVYQFSGSRRWLMPLGSEKEVERKKIN